MLIVNISYVVVCLLVFQIKPFDAHVLQPTDTKIKHALFGGGNIYIYIYFHKVYPACKSPPGQLLFQRRGSPPRPRPSPQPPPAPEQPGVN